MNWKRITLTPDDISAGRHFQMQQAFSDRFIPLAIGRRAAVLLQREDSNRTGAYVYYLSPDAAEISEPILLAYRAEDCAAPKKEEVRLLVGHADWADHLVLG